MDTKPHFDKNKGLRVVKKGHAAAFLCLRIVCFISHLIFWTKATMNTKEEKIVQESAYDLDGFLEDLHKYMIVYTDGDVVNGAIPVGQTVGLIDSLMDVDDIVTTFTKEAEKKLKNLVSKIS